MKKNKLLLVNIIIIFLLEQSLSISFFKEINLCNLFYTVISSIVLGNIITIITTLSNNKKFNKILNIIILFFITIIYLGQFIHYKFYLIVFSIYSMFHGGQVFTWFDQILKVIIDNLFYDILLIIPFIIFLFIKKLDYNKISLKESLTKLLFITSSLLIMLISFNFIDKNSTYSPYNLYYNMHTPTITVKKLGLFNTMNLDLKRLIFGFNEKIELDSMTSSSLDSNKYNVTNLDFTKLETDSLDIKEINNYFSTKTPTLKNDYTNYFKDKNLIYIMAESFNFNLIDETLTPTLYKLYQEGITFKNYYNPIYYASTSDGEYILNTSYLPKEGTWSFVSLKNNYLPYSLGNMFKNNSYHTYAFHNGNYDYYDRDEIYKTLGFDTYVACGNGLEDKMNCNNFPNSDLEMFNASYNYYQNEDKFLVYYMTISGHLSYNFNNNDMAIKNKDYVKNLSSSTSLKAYLSSNIELDKALESLINMLENNNLLDDTVIIIGADHYPYGLLKDELNELENTIKDEKFDFHKNNLVIWNNNLTKKIEVEKYASNLDILPTIYNLYGFTYDSRLLMGNDLFSNEEGLVIFNDRSFITSYGKYNSLNNKFSSFNSKINNNYITKKNKEINNKFAISRKVLETDYYSYLKNYLK